MAEYQAISDCAGSNGLPVKPKETVVNMFAGVGSFSTLIVCHSKARKAFSIDVNPLAVSLMRENAKLNRVENKLVPILGDAKDIVMKHLQNIADRVIMPLPQKAPPIWTMHSWL